MASLDAFEHQLPHLLALLSYLLQEALEGPRLQVLGLDVHLVAEVDYVILELARLRVVNFPKE